MFTAMEERSWICKESWQEMKLKKICAYDSGVRRDDGRKNECSALIIAKMAIEICVRAIAA